MLGRLDSHPAKVEAVGIPARPYGEVLVHKAVPVEFSLFDDRGPVHLTLRDAQVMGELFQRLIQSSWCKPLVVAHHELA